MPVGYYTWRPGAPAPRHRTRRRAEVDRERTKRQKAARKAQRR